MASGSMFTRQWTTSQYLAFNPKLDKRQEYQHQKVTYARRTMIGAQFFSAHYNKTYQTHIKAAGGRETICWSRQMDYNCKD